MTITTRPKISDREWPIPFEQLPEEIQEKLYIKAKAEYERLISIQFQLCYHANISIRDLDDMIRYEYLEFYKALREQKDAEKKAIDESVKSKGV